MDYKVSSNKVTKSLSKFLVQGEPRPGTRISIYLRACDEMDAWHIAMEASPRLINDTNLRIVKDPPGDISDMRQGIRGVYNTSWSCVGDHYDPQ